MGSPFFLRIFNDTRFGRSRCRSFYASAYFFLFALCHHLFLYVSSWTIPLSCSTTLYNDYYFPAFAAYERNFMHIINVSALHVHNQKSRSFHRPTR